MSESCRGIAPVQDFANKVAIVTGTTGIGKAVAKRLACGGAHVVACGIDSAANAGLQREAASRSLSIEIQHCDVSSPEDAKAAVAKCVQLFGVLDILINSAAI